MAPIERIISKKVGIVNSCQLIGANMLKIIQCFGLRFTTEAWIHGEVECIDHGWEGGYLMALMGESPKQFTEHL